MIADVNGEFRIATGLHANGRLAEAQSRYRTVLKHDVRHFGALCGLGLLLIQKGDFSEATVIWRQAVAVDKRSAEARNGLAGAFTGLKQFDQAIRHYEKAIALRPDFAEAHNNLGYVLQLLHKNPEAVAHFERALKLIPDYAEAQNNLGNALQDQGKLEQALDHYRQALINRPNYSEAHHNLANALSGLGRYEEALRESEKVLARNPNFAAAYVAQGNVLLLLDRADEAIIRYRKAVEVKTDYAEGHVRLGEAIYDTGQIEQAVSHYERALAIDFDNAAAHNSLGTALKALGRMEEASRAFEKAIAAAPDQMSGYYNFVYCRRVTSEHPQVLAMRKIARRSSRLSHEQQMFLQFGLAKISADAGEDRQSFDHLLRANRLARDLAKYDEAETLEYLKRIEKVFTRQVLRERADEGFESTLPVFIVGMPRSGTTLVEQILASHPNVYGAGELYDIGRIVRNITQIDGKAYPDEVPNLTARELRTQGESYIKAIRSFSQTAERITDKLPANFVHLGLINLILPGARIVHIRRDPIDTAMSCFSLLFLRRTGGLAANYSYDLGELGRFYRAYRKLMAHWRAVLPADVMLEIDYERIVDDFDAQARRIVAHCGLEWDDACAKFYQSRRPVTTPSATQVRQPIYNTSVGRWRPDDEQLKRFTDALTSE
jgi:tetratricopeptide (TPR) repeat protein